MPKPTTYQRPLPVKRQKFGATHYDSPFGKPDTKSPKPASRKQIDTGLKLDLNLPRLPRP